MQWSPTMAKANLTLQLDAEVIRRARILAARRDMSVSALVAHELDAVIAREARYDDARLRALDLMAGARPRGGRTWTRDDLYAERLDRYGR